MKVLVVAAHPDDELLGCGATLARHVAEGDSVDVLIAAEGATARDDARDVEQRLPEVDALREAGAAAARMLGLNVPTFAAFPDNRMDTVAILDVVKVVERCIERVRPETVYTHWHGDLNVDHRIVHQAVVTACRPLPDQRVRNLYTFETISSSEWSRAAFEFRPTRFVDVSAFLELKQDALGCYRSEMRAFPHARSLEGVEALARYRGVSAGMNAAEAFEVVWQRV